MEELLAEIAAFREQHTMSEREFGIRSMNDHKFLADLESGRSPSLRTVDRVRTFMRDYQPDAEARAA